MSKINSNQSLLLRVINTLASWQDKRFLWALMVFVCVALVFVAHFVFQEYAFMRPCEQCVYIRYAFLVMALGGIIALIKPQNTILKLIAYALAFFGAVRGVMFSVKLNGIHHAAHSEDAIFGVQGCSTVPSFDFGLPLDKWFPSLFAPTGDCGFDYSTPPSDLVLEGFQKWLVELYADGWYLVPSAQFGNMAECCLLAFAMCLVALSVMFLSWIGRKVFA